MKDRFGNNWDQAKGTHFWRGPQLSRRLFFRHTMSAVGGYFLLPTRPMEMVAKAAVTPIGTAKNCIFILMQGGPTHTDTFDLKVGAWTPSYMNPTSYNGMMFPQGLMPKIADQLDSISLVRSVRAWATAHGLSQTWAQIGRNPVSGLSRIAPHIGSVVSLELNASSKDHSLPPFVSLNTGSGPGSGYLAPDFGPFYINPGGGGLGNNMHPNGNVVFDRRYGLLQEMDAETKESGALGPAITEMAQYNLSARKLMYNADVDRVFTFDQNTRNLYGNTGFGNACITARNLIRSNLGTRFIQITHGSWDHHSNIYAVNGPLQTMSRQFDNGLGQLIADLKSDGTLDQTLIIAFGEFGRTVGPVNAQAGRDHFLQQSMLVAGAQVKGKRAIGTTDEIGSSIVDPGWSQGREIHFEDIEATIYSAMGIDWTTVRHDDPLGRGFEYVPQTGAVPYVPINELWS